MRDSPPWRFQWNRGGEAGSRKHPWLNGNSGSGWRRICCDAALRTDAERTVRGCGGILRHLVNALLGAGPARPRHRARRQVREGVGSWRFWAVMDSCCSSIWG